jgi:hypothetical protein
MRFPLLKEHYFESVNVTIGFGILSIQMPVSSGVFFK